MNGIQQKHHVIYKTEAPLIGPGGQYISVFSRSLAKLSYIIHTIYLATNCPLDGASVRSVLEYPFTWSFSHASKNVACQIS